MTLDRELEKLVRAKIGTASLDIGRRLDKIRNEIMSLELDIGERLNRLDEEIMGLFVKYEKAHAINKDD